MEALFNLVDALGGFIASCLVCVSAALGICKCYFADKEFLRKELKEVDNRIEKTKESILKQTVNKESFLDLKKTQEDQSKQLNSLKQSIDQLILKLEETKNHKSDIGEVIKGLRHDFELHLCDLKTDLRATLAEVKEKQDTLAEANLEIRLQLQENKTKLEDYIGGGFHHEK